MTRPEHILTVEDPIEFIYESVKSVIHQRRRGRHQELATSEFLREDPDVISLASCDLETIPVSTSAAERVT